MKRLSHLVEHECPNCGKSMTIGWIGSTSISGKITFWEGERIDVPTFRRKGLQSRWNPKLLRAYRCKECGIYICYEQGKQPE